MRSVRFSFVDAIDRIGATVWNQFAGEDYPFLRYEYLHALEASRSVCEESGWQPRHVIAQDGDTVVGLMPLYLKSHSWGEYVFDWSWANAYQQHGLPYYPKLLTAVPFTPCQGPRLLWRDGNHARHTAELVSAVQAHAVEHGCSSWHLLFPDQALQTDLDRQPLLKRIGVQFHWHNPGCDDFAQFLGLFTSKRRKNIRREREKVARSGITFRWFEGSEISDALLHRFYTFYQATYLKRGQKGYLTLDFFRHTLESMSQQTLLIMAEYEGREVAAAWFYKGSDTLYGRYWGCLEEFDYLHFETCYYQGLDYCFSRELRCFDAGAQGEHKLLRGFEPRYTASYHWIAEPAFSAAIERFLEAEASHVHGYLEEAKSVLPYRRDNRRDSR